MTSPRRGPVASSMQSIPSAPQEPPRRDARWPWVAVTSVKIPLARGKQNYYSKKCYQFNSGAALLLTLGGKNDSVDFLCTNQASMQDEQSFLSWEKNENVF